MLSHKYDELEYAKEVYKNGFQSAFVRYEIMVLVKYLKFLGYDKKNTEREIYNFCQEHIENFNEVKFYKVIDGAIRDGRKLSSPLIIVKSIPIYVKELEYIDSLNIEHEYKKLLLSMYVKKKISLEIHKLTNEKAKLSLYVNAHRKNAKEIFESAKITGKHKFDYMVNYLLNKEIIGLVYNGDVVLECISNMDEICEDDEVYYNLLNSEFNYCGLVFDLYKSVNRVKVCGRCCQIIKCNGRKDNSRKYCDKCSKIINTEKTRERVRKHREKQNIATETPLKNKI